VPAVVDILGLCLKKYFRHAVLYQQTDGISVVYLLCPVKGRDEGKAVYRPGVALRVPGS